MHSICIFLGPNHCVDPVYVGAALDALPDKAP
jgi:hypothetical protein